MLKAFGRPAPAPFTAHRQTRPQYFISPCNVKQLGPPRLFAATPSPKRPRASSDNEAESPSPRVAAPEDGPAPPTAPATAEEAQTAAAAAAAAAAEEDATFKPVTWQRMFKLAFNKVRANLWPLLLVHALCDATVFALHRLSHRFTNELAVNFLVGGTLSPAAIGNMWWLTSDPAIANFTTGYQTLTVLVFLLAFPLNVLLKTLASVATILLCEKESVTGQEESSDVELAWWRPVAGLKYAARAVRGVAPLVSSIWARVFAVELLVSSAVIPLQFASMAVITLPLTLPLILSLHAAAPAAVLEERSGWDAVQRSRHLVGLIRWALAVPFVGLVVGQRLLEAGKGNLLSAMPPRFYKEIIEVPAVVLIGSMAAAVLLARMQDVLPFVAFKEARRREESEQRQAAGGEEGTLAVQT